MAVRVVTDPAVVETPAVTSRRGIVGTVGRGLAGNRKAVAGLALFGFFLLVALLAPLIAPYDPHALQFSQMLQPSRTHLLGTTGTGQDIFSQLVFGTRESLLIALGAGLGATVVSVIIGVSAAYMGGLSDHVLNLFTDVFLVLPTLPLMIIVGTYLHNRGLPVLIGVIVITGWSYGARQLRSQALSLRPGVPGGSAGAWRAKPPIIVFEVLPNMTPRRHLLRRGAVRGPRGGGTSVHRPGRPQLVQLGHDALGSGQRSAASSPVWVRRAGIPPWAAPSC
jgi:peptide/nickel transport system permease protein